MKNLLIERFSRVATFFLVILVLLGCSSDDGPGSKPEEPEVEEELLVAKDDVFETSENETLLIEELLENDSIDDFARITEFDSETVEGGTVENNRNGTYTYSPPQDFIGEDSFEYTICDNADNPNCSTATVKITVTAASPVAVDDSYQTTEDEPLSISNFLSNDELLDNASLSSVDSENLNGTVVVEADGTIVYSPENGFAGVDVFTYTICDDDESPTCSTATIAVTVIDEGSPVAKDDQIVMDINKSEVVIDNVLDNDDPIDDATLKSIDDTGSKGDVVLNDDGTITYHPLAGFTGEDTFTYSLCDDDSPEPSCVTATVTVTVIEPINFNIPSELITYYEDIVLSDNGDLNFQELLELTTGNHKTILSYGQRHEFLYDADEDLDNPENVILMYSGESRYWKEYTSGSNSYEPQTFNTEHIFPQSRLESATAVTDLHHLRVADAAINSQRLNHPYTDGSGEYHLEGSAWFPGEEWKGDVARMVMYLNIRYGEEFNKVGNLELFLKWNSEDPVSEFERQRNDVIQSAQGNRNPFIDNPYLATLIWGGEPADNLWE